MTDWNNCPAAERKPGKVSGAWVFSGTRIPLSALYENLASGATVNEFVEWFLGVDKKQVRAVLEHEVQALRTALARCSCYLIKERQPPCGAIFRRIPWTRWRTRAAPTRKTAIHLIWRNLARNEAIYCPG